MTPYQRYTNAYIAGTALGVVLLSSFILTGQGLGASGAFADIAAGLVRTAAPKYAASNDYFSSYLSNGVPWTSWMVIEILGVLIGGALSAVLAGRFRTEFSRPQFVMPTTRLILAAAGGVVMGFGAVFARGCTSGQALSGGALLSVGSWAFMISVFASGYLAAPVVRRFWR